MGYQKVKTKKEKEIEKGIDINYCKFHIHIPSSKTWPKREIDIVYKQTTFKHEDNKFVVNQIARHFDLFKTKNGRKEITPFRIIKVEILKFLGIGIYEEA